MLERIKRDAKRSQGSAFTAGTCANYIIQWVKYLSFHVFFGLLGFPASTEILVWYTQFISRTLKSHSSVVGYLSGVKKLHQMLGCSIRGFHGYALKLTLQGLHRLNEHVPHRAAPVTPHILRMVHSVVNMDDPDEAVFWTICLMAFFLLFRKSNLVPDTQTGFNSRRQVKHLDCVVTRDRIIVGIRWAKNIQFSRELLTFPLPKLKGSVLCPYSALINMRRLVPWTGDDHLFKLRNGNSFTYRRFQNLCREKLKKVVIANFSDFSSHSFHRGGCTFNFLCGVPTEIIKLLGNWKSDAYLSYIEFPLESRTAASELVKRCILLFEHAKHKC